MKYEGETLKTRDFEKKSLSDEGMSRRDKISVANFKMKQDAREG